MCCVLQFVKHESAVFVQRAFRRQFSSDPPSPNSIIRWYQQFQTTGCVYKRKNAGRPRVSEESVERVRAFSSQSEEICAPCKSWIGDVEYDCGGCCERDSTWNPTVFTCCSFWNRHTTSNEVTSALKACQDGWWRQPACGSDKWTF